MPSSIARTAMSAMPSTCGVLAVRRVRLLRFRLLLPHWIVYPLGNDLHLPRLAACQRSSAGDVAVNESHCGIYIGNGQMIHCATYGVGVIIGPVQSGMVFVRY